MVPYILHQRRVFRLGSHLGGLISWRERPPPTPAGIICNFPSRAAAVKCLIVMVTTQGLPLTFAGLRKSPRGIRARWHGFGTSFVFVWDKSKRRQKVRPAKKPKKTRRLRTDRCAFEARLAFEIVEKETRNVYVGLTWKRSVQKDR